MKKANLKNENMTIINRHKWTLLFNSQRYLSDVNYIRREDTFNDLSVTYIKNLKGKQI